jgi:hypothetical protein
MKKKNLRNLAILGISSGLLISTQASAANANGSSPKATFQAAKSSGKIAFNDTDTSKDKDDKKNKYKDANDGNVGYHEMTEDELLIELDSDGVAMYNSLTPEGKALARKVASMRCNGTNLCKGLNACATDKNDCAGKGQCKGQGKCALSDKKVAVKLVRDKMAQKRDDAATPAKR